MTDVTVEQRMLTRATELWDEIDADRAADAAYARDIREREKARQARQRRIADDLKTQERRDLEGFGDQLGPQITKERKREIVKNVLAAEKAEGITIPAGASMKELLETPPTGDMFVFEGLIHEGGNVLVVAQRKAGKTSLRNNLVRSLVDGVPFLDHFATTSRRRVAVLDLEMTEATTHRWIAELGITHAEDATIFHLRGAVGSLALMDDATRARWAKELRGFDVLILDPLRPLLDALGLDEHRDAGLVLNAFDALKKEADIPIGVVVHHAGHGAGGRARGDSRIEDWPDSIIRLTTDDPNDANALRFLSAQGRDVDVDKGVVSMYDGRRLAFAPQADGDVQAMRVNRSIDALVDALAVHGEMKTADIYTLEIPLLNKNEAAGPLRQVAQDGRITVRKEGNANIYGPPRA